MPRSEAPTAVLGWYGRFGQGASLLAGSASNKRRYKVTTDSKHGLPVALDRNFTPTAPNQVWTPDITYLWTDEGWLYLAIVLDLFNREVVGWSLKPRMTADIVTDPLTMVSTRRTHL